MKLGIRTKLFLLSVTLIAVSLTAADLYLEASLERMMTASIEQNLLVRLDLLERAVSQAQLAPDDRRGWDLLADDLGRQARARVTIIRRDGVVLGDSEMSEASVASMENHGDRPEIEQTFASGRGESTRYSTTVKSRMLYGAVRFRRGGEPAGVVRAALPLVVIDRALGQLRWLLVTASLLALGLAIVLTGVAAHLASRTVRSLTAAAREMAGGNLSAGVAVGGHDELALLGRTLGQLARNLSRSLTELRSERDLLQGILNAMREGVLLLDGESRLSLLNPALREMFLLTPDVVGRPMLEVIRHAGLKAIVDRARGSGEPISEEIEIAGIKPRRVLVHASELSPLRGSNRGALIVFVDVTDIRRLEAMRRDFAANASHELRTPVASARSALETLKEAWKSDPESAAEFLDIVERNVKRLHLLIEDLLDLSRIESRELKLQLEPVLLGPAIAAAVELFREKAEGKRVSLRPDSPAEPLHARADRRALEHVLCNLVDNAIKYCPEECEVRISAALEGSFVRVAVEDSGPGIEEEHLPRLFERFYRVDPGRSRLLGGTGLGLAIVKHLVEAMAGTVEVRSEPGRGTTFSFTLPLG